jgi:pyridoxine 4-dehydrogenase
LSWLLSLRPNVLRIPGTSSIRHLQENMAVAIIELDAEARELLVSMAQQLKTQQRWGSLRP